MKTIIILLLILILSLGCLQNSTKFKLPQFDMDAKPIQKKECDKVNGIFDEYGYASNSTCSIPNKDGTYTRLHYEYVNGQWIINRPINEKVVP